MAAINPVILKKVGTTTPTAITPVIAALCRELSPDHRPRLVPVRPATNATVAECFDNVLAKVAHDGGSIVYGWTIWAWPRVFVEAEHHGVWDDGTGSLTDVTPHLHGERRIMFLPDPGRVYDFVGRRPLINVKRSIGEVEAAQHWIDASDRIARFLDAHSDGEAYRYDRRDMEPLAREVQRTKADVMVSLAMTTSPNDSCVCGGRQKFRKCCGPHIDLDAG